MRGEVWHPLQGVMGKLLLNETTGILLYIEAAGQILHALISNEPILVQSSCSEMCLKSGSVVSYTISLPNFCVYTYDAAQC